MNSDCELVNQSSSFKVTVFSLFWPYLVLWLVLVYLFWKRRHLPPIRQRSPTLLLLSSIGGIFILFYGALAQQYFSNLQCHLFLYFCMVFVPLYTIPYVLRCVRLYLIFFSNMAKLSVKSASFSPVSLSRVLESEPSTDGDVESGLKILHEDERRPIKSVSKEQESLALRLKSILSWENRLSERYLVAIVVLCVFGLIVLATIIDATAFPWTFSPLDDLGLCNCARTQRGGLRAIGGITLVTVFIYIVFMYMLRSVRDEFSINRELLIVCILNVLLLVPFFAFQFQTNNNLSWPNNPVPGFLGAAHVLLITFVSVFLPLFRSYKSSMMDEEKKSLALLQSNLHTTLLDRPSLKKFLDDAEARLVFKQYLVGEFSVENLLFWEDVRNFRNIQSQDDRRDAAFRIRDEYIVNGSDYELNISSRVRSQTLEKVGEDPSSFTVFDETVDAVVQSMELDSFQRFIISPLYKEYRRKSVELHSRLQSADLL